MCNNRHLQYEPNITYLCNCDGPDRVKSTFRPVETYRDGICLECHYMAVAQLTPATVQAPRRKAKSHSNLKGGGSHANLHLS
jgi:hypothetical protein